MPTPTRMLSAPPKVLSGREIYDSIMSQIEPELVSSQLSLLAEKYKNETPMQGEVRKERYNIAFAKYYEAMEQYFTALEEQVHRYHRESLKSLEEQHRLSTETDSLSSLEAAITAA